MMFSFACDHLISPQPRRSRGPFKFQMAFDLTHVLVGAALLLRRFCQRRHRSRLSADRHSNDRAPFRYPHRSHGPYFTKSFYGFGTGDSRWASVRCLPTFLEFDLADIIGVFLGTMALVNTPLWILNLCLGMLVLVFVLSSLLKFDFSVSPRWEKILSPVFGFLSGFLNGLTNAAGPALAIYLYSLKLEKRNFVKSIATIFVTTKLTQLVAISTWNLFNWDTISLSVQVLLFTLVGFYAGIKAQDRVNQRTSIGAYCFCFLSWV